MLKEGACIKCRDAEDRKRVRISLAEAGIFTRYDDTKDGYWLVVTNRN